MRVHPERVVSVRRSWAPAVIGVRSRRSVLKNLGVKFPVGVDLLRECAFSGRESVVAGGRTRRMRAHEHAHARMSWHVPKRTFIG